jgi:integrase
LCKKFNKNISSAGIHSILTSLKGIIEMIIAAYSGMRRSEIASLKTGCFTVTNNISKITGYTTKFSDKGIPLQVDWITSPKIKIAINTLEKITKSISIARNIPHKDMYLMFNNFLVSKYGNISDDTWKYPRSSGMSCNSKYNTLVPLDIKINKEDIEELSVFTPSRDIENEFTINDNWDIKLHQFRRTLIINALSSRLVSVGGLQRQLKHTTKEMTMYYGKGSSNADLHFNKNDFAIEFKKAMPQIEALNYIYDVLFSTESLYGEMGKQVEDSKVKDVDDYKLYYLENRTMTEKEIKEGRLKYSQTALGGCTSLTECDKKLTFSVTSCFDCKSVILKESKINKVIEKTQWFLSTLNQNTPEYRSTQEDLNNLLKAKEKAIL